MLRSRKLQKVESIDLPSEKFSCNCERAEELESVKNRGIFLTKYVIEHLLHFFLAHSQEICTFTHSFIHSLLYSVQDRSINVLLS